MLKALKGFKKRLGGSSSKLQDERLSEAPPAAAAAPAATAEAVAPPAPVPAGLPPRPPAQHAAPAAEGGRHAVAPTAAVPAAPGGSAPEPELPNLGLVQRSSPAPASAVEALAEGPGVDYELVAGPLDLDSASPERAGEAEAPVAGQRAAEQPVAAADAAQQAEQEEVCYGSGAAPGSPGEPCAVEAAAAAEVLAGGDGDDAGGDGLVCAAAGGDSVAGPSAEGEPISDALATVMYLTGDAEGQDDCVSVVSEAISEEDLPDDISELSRALEALEGETLGSSPGAPAGGIMGGPGGGLEGRLAELGLSPDADSTAFAQQMAKLYNNLGLKMMERRKHEEALGLLRKAEAVVDNDAVWQGPGAEKRARMRAITYNNLGCLFKRRNMPQLALQYLQKALALEDSVQNSASTHLNICAAYSSLRKPKEALSHAERAILLLQRHLWAHSLPFQDGLNTLVRQLAAPGASRHLLASANVLAMAYHNAAVEHEKLVRLREALVSFTRAYLIASKCLGAKAQITTSLSRALKAFQQRQARHLPTGAAHAARKAPTLTSSRTAASTTQGKRGLTRTSNKSAASSKSASNLSSKAVAGSTLPLDKGRTTGSLPTLRPPSSSRLASQLQAAQQQG
ncbi:hypothetical protein ABPG77_002058 [Micractinium sp. CCAP 211/92]